MPIYIIEHLEGRLWDWCLIEYKHISSFVGKDNLWITNVKRKSKNTQILEQYAKVLKESVTQLNLSKVCVLDPEAPQTLTAPDAQKYAYFVFGGILGDDPPRKRTEPELTQKMKNIEVRNLGQKQMSTDNAVYVTQEIVKGQELKNLIFQDTIEIATGKGESVILPYHYRLLNGKPFLSSELVQYLIKKKGF